MCIILGLKIWLYGPGFIIKDNFISELKKQLLRCKIKYMV